MGLRKSVSSAASGSRAQTPFLSVALAAYDVCARSGGGLRARRCVGRDNMLAPSPNAVAQRGATRYLCLLAADARG